MNAHDMRKVAGALRSTTEVLAAELACPTDRTPDWSAFEWRIARAVVTMHGVSALLSRGLRWQAPDDWLVFLRDQAEHTARRHERIQRLLTDIDSTARSRGIPVLPLKGAALYASGVYASGTRPMADVDLLVREQDLPRSVQLLAALGYQQLYAVPRHIILKPRDCPPPQPFGEHAANGIKIELHARISEPLPQRHVELTKLLFPDAARPGSNDYPAQSALLAHMLLHAAGAMAQRGLRLLHLQDIARLSGRMSAAEWEDLVLGFADTGRGLWWAYPPLMLAARYGAKIPQPVLDATAAGCPLLLKRSCARMSLSDVSLSYPWIEAFPGIEWSRSTGETLTYVARRLVPSRAHVRGRRDVVRHELMHSTDSWSKLSQLGRMWRWMSSRQSRVATMHTVREALAQRP